MFISMKSVSQEISFLKPGLNCVQGSAALEVLVSNQAARGGKGMCSRIFASARELLYIVRSFFCTF
jgi:hypothetical protein